VLCEAVVVKSYSIDLRERLVAGRRRGQSAEELARVFGVSKRSVERYWKRQVQEGTLEAKARGGYRRSRLEGHDELLRQWIQQQPDLSLEQLRERLLAQLDIPIGTTALWHRLEKLGLSYKKNAARRRTRQA
jgi:transposase